MRPPLLLLVLAALGIAQDAAPEATPTTHDLRVFAKPAEEIFIAVKARVDSDLAIELPTGKTADYKRKMQIDGRVVDWYRKVEKDRVDMCRHYVKWEQTVDGRVDDPEVTGVTFKLAQADGKISVEVADDRSVSPPWLRRQLAMSDCIGLWLGLPKEARVGDSFAVDFRSMAALLMDLEEPPSRVTAEMRLESVDEAGRARLQGELKIEASESADEGSLSTRFVGTCVLTVDTGAARITEIAYKGTGEASGVITGRPAKGEARFDVTVTAKTGSAASTALKARPRYRDTVRELGQFDLTFALPSHWIDLGLAEDPDDRAWIFESSLDHSEQRRRLRVWSMESAEGAPAVKFAADQALERLQNLEPKRRSLSTKLGKGWTIEWTEGDFFYVMDLIASKDLLVNMTCRCPKKEKAAVLKEIRKLRSSLKRLR